MARVECGVEETELENENGDYVPGVLVTCSECGYMTESFGTSDASVNRCLALLREECPEGKRNFYVRDDE